MTSAGPYPPLHSDPRQMDAADLREAFRNLADTWRDEVGDSSIMQKKIMHPAYQRIIGLGPAAVPLLLQELKQAPSYWFWALSCMTGENPVRTDASFAQTVEDWLAWGRARGLID